MNPIFHWEAPGRERETETVCLTAGPALLSLTSPQGGEVPVLPVIVSQGQNLLLLDLVASLGGKSELLGKIGIHCIPIVSRDVSQELPLQGIGYDEL